MFASIFYSYDFVSLRIQNIGSLNSILCREHFALSLNNMRLFKNVLGNFLRMKSYISKWSEKEIKINFCVSLQDTTFLQTAFWLFSILYLTRATHTVYSYTV